MRFSAVKALAFARAETSRTRTGLLLGVAVALSVCVGPAQAAFPGTNGEIVFASDRDGAQDVYAMTANGVIQRQLTNAEGDDQYPVWSPDGQQIVFSSQRELAHHKIFKMNAGGSAQTRVADSTFEDLEPSWSRDMARIAFRRDFNGTTQIWSMNAGSGDDLQQLTDAGENLNPMWSPTADTIAFASNRDGDYEIFLMDGNGGNERVRTINAAFDSNPDWSPDGSRIAFQSDRDGDFDIWVMNANGTGVEQMTDGSARDSAPAWSPDGSKIAFQSDRDGDFEIYTMPAVGGQPTQLTHNTATDRVADWQPLQGPDNTPPVLALPADKTAVASSPAGAIVTFSVSATDIVDQNPTVVCSPASGAVFALGSTTVSCTASDASGNQSNGSFTVTVETPNTPAGTLVSVTPVDTTTGSTPVRIVFDDVIAGGHTTLTSSSSGPPPPAGFELAGVYFELATTAQFALGAEVCFSHNLPDTPVVGHYENGGWTTLEPSQSSSNEICVRVTSFSPFALLVPESTGEDSDPPVIACGATDGAWHGANVSVDCTAEDHGSGLADPADSAFSLSTSVPAGDEDGNASTDSRRVCDLAGNCAEAGPIGAHKIDRKSPTLSLPSDKTVDATSSAGATVSYVSSASDGADPHPGVSCSPSPASVFAIGTTSVTCTATDHVGNTTDGSFTVTVRSAKQQLARLIQDVVAASKLPAAVKAGLLARLQPLLAAFDPGNAAQRRTVCAGLATFTAVVRLLSGPGIAPAQAAAWIADATRIRAVVGC